MGAACLATGGDCLCPSAYRIDEPVRRLGIDLEEERRFEQLGFAAFADEFARHDVLLGNQIDAHGPQGVRTGRGAGVDARGALLLETADGCEVIDSAEISIRPSGFAP